MTLLRTLFLTAGALAILQGATARAASVSISFLPPTLSAAPGETVIYRGTITNLESVVVDLNACDVNLPGAFTTDCGDGFFLTLAPLTLNPGDTSDVFDIFSVTVGQPYTGLPGLQPPGIFTVTGALETGGPGDPSQIILGVQNFEVVVVPEPASAILLGLGLPLALAIRRRGAQSEPRL